jgi:glycosyltransferase involved in cell wall biosynthesis
LKWLTIMADRKAGNTRIALVGLTQREDTQAFGGAPVVVVNLANELSRRGVPVDVLIFTRRGVTEFPFPFDPKVTLHYLRARARGRLFSQLISHLLRIRPAVMLAIGTKANLLCAYATRMPGVRARFWASFHHNLSSEMSGWSARKRRRRIRLWRRILARAEGLIGVSRGVADDFVSETGIDAAKIRVVYNPIVTPGLEARAAEPVAHPWLTGTGPPVILGVGRLTGQKDFATLVSAFALVRGRRPCRLLIIGEGEEREHLEALAAMLGVTDGLDLAGFKPNPLPFMREARLLVMSSRWEGFGNVLVEALFCGTPVVSTDCPHGPREVLADGKLGRLVPVADPQALAEAIVEALDKAPDPPRLKARAADFSAARSVDGYLDAMGFAPSGVASRDC